MGTAISAPLLRCVWTDVSGSIYTDPTGKEHTSIKTHLEDFPIRVKGLDLPPDTIVEIGTLSHLFEAQYFRDSGFYALPGHVTLTGSTAVYHAEEEPPTKPIEAR